MSLIGVVFARASLGSGPLSLSFADRGVDSCDCLILGLTPLATIKGDGLASSSCTYPALNRTGKKESLPCGSVILPNLAFSLVSV